MSLIKKEIINNYNLYYYDEQWQEPVITEKRTFQLFYKYKSLPCNYFAFPWAELCDKPYNNKLNSNVIKELNNYKISDSICFTVLQHIHFRKLLPLLKKIGITHIFVSHKQKNDHILEKKFKIKILAYPLYPLQHNESNVIQIDKRKFFASFIGQYEKYYLSKVRLDIFENFNKLNDCQIIRRVKWHYHEIVYGNTNKTNIEYEKEYKENLANTIFSLCPSGSGSNSIRIWESMSFGCIPVILADNLLLPDIDNIYYNEFFIFWEEKNIKNLYEHLKTLDKETLINMSNKNLEMYNKYFSVDKINESIINFFS